MNTNKIVAYNLALRPNLKQVYRMLDKAIRKINLSRLIFLANQGWQYQHNYFRKALKEHDIIQSMFRKENCYDSCVIETFFVRLKTEIYYNNKRVQVKQNGCPL